MSRWWQLRVAAGALLTAASYPIIALGYLADWYRLALAGVFFLWLIRFVIARAGHRDLTPAWRRLRNYVFLQQLAIQFAIRSTAVFLIITAGFGDTEFVELFTLAVVVQLAGRHFSPVLLRGAFSERVASRNMRNVGDDGSTGCAGSREASFSSARERDETREARSWDERPGGEDREAVQGVSSSFENRTGSRRSRNPPPDRPGRSIPGRTVWFRDVCF